MTLLRSLPLVLLTSALACSSSSSPTAPGSDAAVTKEKDAGHDTASRADAHTTARDAGHDAGHSSTKPDAGHDAGHDVAAPVDAPSDVLVVADVGGPSDAGKPPPRTGTTTAAATPTNFAIHHLWLGDSLPEPTFPPDTMGTAWSTFGYNIDGLITNQYSTDVCTLNTSAGATTAIQVDGQDGIDNSFGRTIVPFLATVLTNLSQTVSSAIAAGDFTVLIDTTGLTSSPTQTNTGLVGSILSGAPYGGAPSVGDGGYFLPTDNWPVFSASLAKGSLDAGGVVSFPTAYVSNGVWVNGSPGDITLVLVLQGQPLVLQIHQAVVSFTHTVDSAGQDHATGGKISGVLKATEFLAEIDEVAAEQDYCTEASLLLNFIAKSADILHDGTNVKGQACDGISIGLEFDAEGIAPPSKVTQSVDAGGLPKPCVADAGG